MIEDYGNYQIKMGDGFTTFKQWVLKAKGTFTIGYPSEPGRSSFYVENPGVAMLKRGQPIMIKCGAIPERIGLLTKELRDMQEAYRTYKNPEVGVKIQKLERQIHDEQKSGTGAIRYIQAIIGKRVILNKPLAVPPKVGGSVTIVLGYSRNYLNEKATEELEKLEKKISGGTWV